MPDSAGESQKRHRSKWRALPERFGPWNSVWKRFDRLSKAGVFEAFFDTLASMSSTAHLLQMFDSTIVRAHGRAEQKGARRAGARTFARRLHHQNPRKIGRLRRHHRLRSDRRRSFRRASLRNSARYRARHSASRRDLSTKATPARPIATPRERAASLPSFPTRPAKRTSQPSSHASSTRPAPPHRAGRRTPQAVQARRAPMRKDSQELQVYRRLRRRPLLDQIRPHRLATSNQSRRMSTFRPKRSSARMPVEFLTLEQRAFRSKRNRPYCHSRASGNSKV